MKAALRTFIFSYLAVYLANSFVGALSFGGVYSQTLVLVLLGLSFLYLFLKPILSIVSLPTKGFGYMFILFVLTLIMIYVLTAFVPSFSVVSTKVSRLVIMGVELPSKNLSAVWASVFSALLISLFYSFFEWLCTRR